MSEQPPAWGVPDGLPQDPPGWAAPPGRAPGSPDLQAFDPTPAQPPAQRSSEPRPTGPNWGLTLLGLVLMGVASAVLVEQLTGVATVTSLESRGPLLLVGAGVVCALVGVVGMARRRP